jgi:hypothetical protein
MVQTGQIAKEEKEFRNKSIDFQKRQIELGEKQQKVSEQQTEIQEKQLEINKNQQAISEKQTNFSRILTLATGVLAFSGLIQIIIIFLNFNFKLREGNLVYLDYFLYGVLIFIGGILLVYIYALLKPQKKNNSA